MFQFLARLLGGSSVVINGRSYQGDVVGVSQGRVIVNGKEVEDLTGAPKIEVTVHGDVDELSTAAGDVTVHGRAGSVKTASGDVRCETVDGDISTASGDVHCKKVAGNVSTVSGDIRR
ncbi:hypothetical protein [Burkholderia cenocepacia]|uniref:hypothetical protein n=1 Tax=Burkholderia cenocepacia TaxID=95486 RepID=UPI0007C7B311|nr:hypothetical protein [Burkholderia cenocepacia]